LKHTPNDHPDFEGLQKAIEKVEFIVADVNKRQITAENLQKIAKLVDNIYWDKLKKPQVHNSHSLTHSLSSFFASLFDLK
jgi:predicted NodU family carbamoyl transferase